MVRPSVPVYARSFGIERHEAKESGISGLLGQRHFFTYTCDLPMCTTSHIRPTTQLRGWARCCRQRCGKSTESLFHDLYLLAKTAYELLLLVGVLFMPSLMTKRLPQNLPRSRNLLSYNAVLMSILSVYRFILVVVAVKLVTAGQATWRCLGVPRTLSTS